jgi:AraC-like DNA-binding protein/quercetin dioxygenase-like cupin family protein
MRYSFSMAVFQRKKEMPIRFVEAASVMGTPGRYTFGKATYLPNGSCGPRVQDHFQLVVMLRGTLRLQADGVVYDLNPGDAILERPGQHEFFRFSPGETSVHTWCEVHANELNRSERRLLRAAPGVFQAPSSVHVLIEEGMAVRDHGEMGDAMAVLARACLLRFAQQVQAERPARDKAPPHPAYARAREMASVHHADLRSAEDLARRAGISATQLRALFRRHGGESPSRMIWRLKVEHAIQLLRSTGLTLGEVATHCGYANPFHLSRAVRRHTGYSPRDMRRLEWRTEGKVKVER